MRNFTLLLCLLPVSPALAQMLPQTMTMSGGQHPTPALPQQTANAFSVINGVSTVVPFLIVARASAKSGAAETLTGGDSRTFHCPNPPTCFVRFRATSGNKTQQVQYGRSYRFQRQGGKFDLWDMTGP